MSAEISAAVMIAAGSMKVSLLTELEEAQSALQDAEASALIAQAARRKAIAQALEAGVKQADIARLTGLSRARIAQLR